MRGRRLTAGWRPTTAAAASMGAIVGMLPGVFLMRVLRDPLPVLVGGPLLFVNGAIFAAVLAIWVANLDRARGGRGMFAPVMTVALATAALVAGLWVLLATTGWWALVFPFPPENGLLGLGLLMGAAVALAAEAYREPFDWDGLDVAATVAWTAVPPALIVALLHAACTVDMCA